MNNQDNSFRKKTIENALKLLIVITVITVSAVTIMGRKSYNHALALDVTIKNVSEFNKELSFAKSKTIQPIHDNNTVATAQNALNRLRTNWAGLPHLVGSDFEGRIISLSTNLDKILKAELERLNLLANAEKLILTSIYESNSYISTMTGNLAEGYSASELEVVSILSANINTDVMHKINMLLYRFYLDSSLAKELFSLLDDTIANAEKAAVLLAETPLAESPRRAVAVNKQLVEIANSMLNNLTELSRQKDAVMQLLDEISRDLESKLEHSTALSLENSKRANIMMSLSSLFLSVISIALAVYLFRIIINPIRHLVKISDDMADGKGDLRHEILVTGKGEISLLSNNFNNFIKALRTIIQNISASSQTLIKQGEVAESQVKDLSTQLNQQQREIDSVATAITEMTVAITEVSHNAHDTSGFTDTTSKAAMDGIQTVNASIRTISQAEDNLQQLVTTMQSLTQSSSEIAGIADIIRAISDQINLLALNAAIEAARAGEHGRGFSVVADEVRTLAEKARKSANSIQDMVEKFSVVTKAAESSAHEGANLTKSASLLAKKVGEEIHTIVKQIKEISERNIQIATSVEEQSGVAEHLNDLVISIKTRSEESYSYSERVLQSTAIVQNQGKALAEQVMYFKV
ncbi:hypothetical protein GCM10010919_00910 [Alishewanella longhuensis]|uniref:Methyl-accepting chemotaxis protein n=1 Tax=Alishewanella longhuensis TaxID=1091037 RepID=A0ABQ3KWM5_9ALTE|nr:methyl-accepting chemotaxis protein [Alishewanella longhuensis]GHG58879.1 hypothetical protein GCM10010919_00910 [Alishewanella longhuensis]